MKAKPAVGHFWHIYSRPENIRKVSKLDLLTRCHAPVTFKKVTNV